MLLHCITPYTDFDIHRWGGSGRFGDWFRLDRCQNVKCIMVQDTLSQLGTFTVYHRKGGSTINSDFFEALFNTSVFFQKIYARPLEVKNTSLVTHCDNDYIYLNENPIACLSNLSVINCKSVPKFIVNLAFPRKNHRK